MIFVDVTYHHYNCIICYGMVSLEVFVVIKTSWVWLVYFSQSNETCLLSLCAPLQFGSGAMSCFASYFLNVEIWDYALDLLIVLK